MTQHEQQATALFPEWVKKLTIFDRWPVITKYDAIDFAAFCLERQSQHPKMQIAINALQDIKNWDDDLEDEWDDPGVRASDALDKILKP